MAQHDYVIANGTGAAVRSDLNNALAAIVSQNSGATAPATTYAFQFWADTTTGLLKLRNSANSAWVTLFQLDGEWSTLPVENGTAAAPSIYFKDSGTDTGFYSPGTDQVGISTGGTARLTIDANGNVAVDTNTLYVDAANNRVGIGTSSPGDVLDAAAGNYRGITIKCGTTAHRPTLSFFNTADSLAAYIQATGNSLQFGSMGTDYGGHTPRMTLSSTGLGIGSTSPLTTLECRGQFSISNNAGSYWVLDRDDSDGRLKFLDSSTSTNERLAVDSSGRLLVGTSTARSNFYNAGTISPQMQIEGTTYNTSTFSIVTNNPSGTGGYPSLVFGKSAGSTVGSNTAVTDGHYLGEISFQGNDGSEFVDGARITAVVDGTSGANDLPTRLVFSTTADGASSPTERMRITQAGFTKITSTGSIYQAAGTYHEMLSGSSNSPVLFCQHSSATGGGVEVYYTNTINGTANRFFWGYDNSATRFEVRSNGGIGNYQANNVNLSDRNAKKDISPAADTWDCIKEWEIVNYRYKDQPDDVDLNLGVIAQQVAESCPEVITVFQEAKEATETEPAQEERLGVKEQQMYWMAIKALQEAQVRIETLEAEVAALKAQ